MKGASQIAPHGVRMPENLKKALVKRAEKNGRSLNAEIVMILQAAIEDRPQSVESFAQEEADNFKAALLETLAKMYGKEEK